MLSLKLRIGLSNHGPGFAPPEAELPEQALALTHPQHDPKAAACKCRQRLAIPQGAGMTDSPRFLAQSRADHADLLCRQTAWAARTFAIHEPRKSPGFKLVDPVFDRSRRISQQTRHLWALHPLGHQEYGMQPMVVARFVGPANFVLQSEHDCRSIGDGQWFHASMTSHSVSMRKYLRRRV